MNKKNKHGAGNGTNISRCGIHFLIIFFKKPLDNACGPATKKSIDVALTVIFKVPS